MKIRPRIILLFLSATTIALQGHAQSTSPTLLDAAKAGIPGNVSLKIQTIFMSRNTGGNEERNDQHAGSTAITFDYLSKDYAFVQLGAQYIHAAQHYSGGSATNTHGSAYALNNSNYDILNELYLKYTLGHRGLDQTYLKVGRQTLDLNFIRPYNIRHKNQAVEGAVLHLGDIPNWTIDLGHLEKFSSFGSQDISSDNGIGNRFEDIEHTITNIYSTPGFQFIEAAYSRTENSAITLYDYYGHDLFNTFGLHINQTVYQGDWKTILKARYVTQTDVGRFTKRINTHAAQFGIQFKRGAFSIEEGLFIVKGSDIRLPFHGNLIVTDPMLGADELSQEDGHTFYLESSYSRGKHGIYGLFLYNEFHGENFGETDLIYGYNATENLYMKVKLAYAFHDTDQWKTDCRLFCGYRF